MTTITAPFSRISDDMLEEETEEMCGACEGRGWNIFATSPDGDKDECPYCEGTGRLKNNQ